MHLTEKQKLMLAIVIFMITGYVLYSTFFSSPSSAVVPPTTADGVPVDTVPENQDIIDLATKFDQMSVNIDLFSSTLFTNLRDLEVPLSPENSGRPNPFATIGNDNFTDQSTIPVGTTTRKTP